MKANWEKVISENMELVQAPGQDTPLYKPKGERAFVVILTGSGDFIQPPPPLDRYEMAPCGGKELHLDISDPDFLLVHKIFGMAEYTHCIPWEKVTDVIFRHV